MFQTGLIGSPPRCSLLTPVCRPKISCRQVPAFYFADKSEEKVAFVLRKRFSSHCRLIKCAMDASFGDTADEHHAIFPRINVRDPYKRLGINIEASEGEIQAARNFLINKYAGHKPSIDAIESAHDKIIMQKFYERKNPKIDMKKKMREISQSRVVQLLRSRFQTPSPKFIIKTSITFLVLGILTILFPTEEGPTLQVAISLIATIYLIYDRLKSKLQAFLYGAGAFALSWLLGTFLMVSIIPPVLKGLRAFEVTTSLISYVLLWISSTYLK